MQARYLEDPESGLPHIFGHGVREREVEEVLNGNGDDLPGHSGARIKLGQTVVGRYLEVIYRVDEDFDEIFVITAYEPTPKTKKALRRRQRRKKP